jgi:hypothetical protein
MKRPFAILLTFAIVCGVPVGITMLVNLIASDDTSSVVGVLVGVAFGTFAIDIYRELRSLGGNGWKRSIRSRAFKLTD